MDSQVRLDWLRASKIDNRWRSEVLSPGEADIPTADLPELDSDVPVLTTKQAEQKWPDAGLQSLLTLAK